MYSLMVADDHPLFRDAITAVIQAGLPGASLREADCFAALAQGLDADDNVDLVLLDLNLPDASGLDGLDTLRRAFPGVAVAVLSAESDRATVLGALDLGAVGYLPKSTPRPDLLAAIKQILDGQIYLPADIMRRPAELSAVRPSPAPAQSTATPVDVLNQLTRKQLEVLSLVIRGASNKVIARELEIAETTVKTHVSAILKKLGVSSRVQAILAADESTLLTCLANRRTR
ncbi:LuxR C-terminal-related transcriptional regulator [Halomonas litopenaei]|uniref:LuxR C-terminal-related transcriptional regulator n=1 Tax=Halomonas litopenaei TaxID=2109328 RepID=UPI001A8DF41E|nr:response regulator transcription factor [Halomonas litopenaei]MBN8411543.1 response regulator transcription factor [Halomonas litopenaei]